MRDHVRREDQSIKATGHGWRSLTHLYSLILGASSHWTVVKGKIFALGSLGTEKGGVCNDMLWSSDSWNTWGMTATGGGSGLH